MPIKFHLRKYLETDNVMKTILENLAPSNDGYIRSVIDGSIWKKRTQHLASKIIIPLNLFFDDFNSGDTVSPHAAQTSVCGIYYYIPSLPGYLLAKLVNILVAGYVLSTDRKEFSNEDLFSNLIDVLVDLETEGLQIKYEGRNLQVYFMIAFITGDNLGLSGILDMVESVRAHFYCRICKRNRTERETDVREYEETFRTIHNYEQDLKLNDVSLTGIKTNSIFNRIPSFHITYNMYFDVMHDVWEGICVYGLRHYLNYFINIKKLFSLDELNNRKNVFVFGSLNSSNIPNDIKDINITKTKVKMTASEIKTLTTFLPLIVGKLIPEQDEVWQHFCLLLKICHIVMLREIPNSMIETLRQLVTLHHAQYQTLFNDTLKPKHHNIVHYASFVVHSGTPRHQWAMRGEAKHRDAKQYSRINNNKINICKSLGIKVAYKFAFNVFNNMFITPLIDFNESKISKLPLAYEYHTLLGGKFQVNKDSASHVDKFWKQGSLFTKGTIFYIIERDLISMYELQAILTDDDKNLFLICYSIHSREFVEHIQSFEVTKINEPKMIFDIRNLQTFTINLHKVDGKLYFRYCNYVNILNT